MDTQPIEPVGTWVRYYANQKKTDDDQYDYFKSKDGYCSIEGLTFKVNDELGVKTVKSGTYELRITDVTKGLPSRMRTKNAKVLIKFLDLDEEAALVAA